MRPFLKWPGGKRWLSKALVRLSEGHNNRYIEPFVGGGATFFSLRPRKALLSDINLDLISTYNIVKNQPGELVDELNKMQINSENFRKIREESPNSPIRAAARFLYLNRTAFNGLYRVNKDGQFNVPFGCKPSTRLPSSREIHDCSRLLHGAQIQNKHFQSTLNRAKSGDIVYVDPPYTVMHNNNAFRRYNENLFSWDDQIALADLCNELSTQGTHMIVTNAFHQSVVRLYDSSVFVGCAVTRPSRMAARASCRGDCVELLLVSRNLLPKRDSLKVLLKEQGYKCESVRLKKRI